MRQIDGMVHNGEIDLMDFAVPAEGAGECQR